MSLPSNRRAAFLAAAAILLSQLAVCLPRLTLPFIDGRAHWNYDAATALLHVAHSRDATVRTPWDWVGVKEYLYDERGNISGAEHYANHPVGLPLVFGLYADALGLEEWVPRSFALLVSMGTTLALFALLLGGLSLPLAGGLTFLYTLLPLYSNYQDSWHHDATAALVMLLALLALARRRPGPFLVAFAVMLQIDWPAYLLAAVLLAWLYRSDRGLFRRALAWGAASAALNACLLLGLGITPERLGARALYRMAHDAGGMGVLAWSLRQAGFLRLNFGLAGLAAFAAALARLAHRRAWRRPSPLAFSGAALAAVGAAWLLIFRNQSHVHHFIQWYLGLGLVLLAGAAAGGEQSRAARAIAAALVLLCALSWRDAMRLRELIHGGNEGMARDIAMVAATQRRLIVADGLSGPRDWWLGAHVRLYTDPVYKARRTGRPLAATVGTFRFVDDVAALEPARDAIVSVRRAETIERWKRRLEPLGVASLKPVAASPSFVFLEPVLHGAGALAKGRRGR